MTELQLLELQNTYSDTFGAENIEVRYIDKYGKKYQTYYSDIKLASKFKRWLEKECSQIISASLQYIY